MQFDNVDFETDSKVTADAFLSSMNDLSESGCIISSCRSLFSNLFSNSSVEFVRRQDNAVAHALAREVISLASSPFILKYPIVLKLSLLMKCYKQVSLNKKRTRSGLSKTWL